MRIHLGPFGRLLLAGLLAAPAALTLGGGAPAMAASSLVTKFTDGGAGSLRSAIQDANADSALDEIELGAGTYTLTIGGAGNNTNATGDLDIVQPISISGAGADRTIIDASALGDRAMHVLGSGGLRLDGVTITGGNAAGDGGAILVENGSTAVIGTSILRGNTAAGNGGAFATNGSFGFSLTTLANNAATGAGHSGGAIYFATTSGNSGIDLSTINNNTAPIGGAVVGSGAKLRFLISTITGNTATTRSALLVQGNDSSSSNAWILDHVTLAGNSAMSGGGAAAHTGTGSISLTDTIVAANAGGNCGGIADSLNGVNVVSDTSCGLASQHLHNLAGADPGLAPLDDNGGLTATRALVAGSPAINRSTCAADTYDQRVLARPVGACDTGAYERTIRTIDDQAYADSQQSLLISVMDNDWGKDETTFAGQHPGVTLAIVSGPQFGTAAFDGLSVRYTSVPGYFGDDTFDYQICVDSTCSTSTVTVSIAQNGATEFVAVAPTRILDTRESGNKPAAGSTTLLTVTGVPGVPATGVVAVVLNLTATDATAPGFVTAWPAGNERPTVSNLNVEFAGQTIPNLATVAVGVDGQVALFTQTGTHLIADIAGYYRPANHQTAGRFTPVTPTRVFDSRTTTPVAAGTSVDVQVAGIDSVPSAASAVVLNVTATNAQAAGFVTVWPAGGARPVVSNLNLTAVGQTIPNLVIVPVGADGKVSLFSQSGTDLVVDIAGWFTDESAPASSVGLFVPVIPYRILDTRDDQPIGAGQTLNVSLSDGGIIAAVLNVTATESQAPGFVTVWPSNVARPTASNLNVDRAGQTIPNSVIVGVGDDADVSFFSQTGTDLVVDLAGYYIIS